MRVARNRLPGEVPWVPNFSYDCTGGHYIQADAEVSQCPAFCLGEPCRGVLVRVGKGSRRALVSA